MRRGPRTDVNRVQTDVSGGSSICNEVVQLVAEAEGTDPVDLTPPLFEVVDPAALESLFADKQALGKVVFNYKSHEVSVFPDGYISVRSFGT